MILAVRSSSSLVLQTGGASLKATRRQRATISSKAWSAPPWSEERVRDKATEEMAKPLQMPKTLSPSAAKDFLDCEQLFLFRHVWKLPQKPSAVMERGNLVHAVLEDVYKEKVPATTDAAQEDFRKRWLKQRPVLAPQFFESLAEEQAWGLEALAMLAKYFRIEDKDAIRVEAVEKWLDDVTIAAKGDAPTLQLRGKLDRLDVVGDDPARGEKILRVVDYKTGEPISKKNQKYSEASQAKYREDAFFQLKVYAYGESSKRPDARVKTLRMVYLGGKGASETDDFGAIDEMDITKSDLDAVEVKLLEIWDAIYERVQTNDPRAFKAKENCKSPFCPCKSIRPLIGFDDAAGAAAKDEGLFRQSSAPVVPAAPKNNGLFTNAPVAAPPVVPPVAPADTYDRMKQKELRAECKERGINAHVKRGEDVKATLIERLRNPDAHRVVV